MRFCTTDRVGEVVLGDEIRELFETLAEASTYGGDMAKDFVTSFGKSGQVQGTKNRLESICLLTRTLGSVKCGVLGQLGGLAAEDAKLMGNGSRIDVV